VTEPVLSRTRHYRSIWISDVHLGFRGCSAETLLDFLRHSTCERLYLVGDIIDIWSMRKRPYWPQAHNNVIRTILGKAKHDTEVIYITGNHDELLRDYDGMQFGNISIKDEHVHVGPDGTRMLVIHGDQFDSVVKCSRLAALIGSKLYEYLLGVNVLVNWVRRHLGFSSWSLAAFLKHKVKNAVQYISNFEHAVAHEARKHGVDGVICGHIHRAGIERIGGVMYCNCGDWVESCTALVEHAGGELEILEFSELAPAQVLATSLQRAA